MAKSHYNLFLIALLASGCAAAPKSSSISAQNEQIACVTPVEFQESIEPAPASPPDTAEPLVNPEQIEVESAPSNFELSLPLTEELALANNPAVAQAQARLRALRGKWLQVGLAPNPTIGYLGSEIGSDGTAGQQGGYLGQQFITAHKLQRNRDIVCAEIKQAEQQLAILIQRVRTDARLRYYNALLAERRLQLATELVHYSQEATETSRTLIQAEEIPLAGLLQTEVQLENAKLLHRTSENEYEQAWRQLQTLMGDSYLTPRALVGNIDDLPELVDFEAQLARLQQASPELAEAMAEVQRTRRVLSRECVEAVPNVSTQLSVQHDNSSDDTIAGVQVGIPLPIWNRNQGGINQARAEVSRAHHNVERVERHLQQRLVDAFREYSDAKMTAEAYASHILTRSQRTLELVRTGYAQGEVGYLDLLTAQRTFSQTNLRYLDALGNLWRSYLRIDGLLLEGSLATDIQ